jgi:S1-C subfamily serine protease
MSHHWFKLIWILLGLALSSCANLSERSVQKDLNVRPQLGIRVRVMPSEGLPKAVLGERQQVLLVVRVKPDQPAARAGIEPGDILLALDGQPVSGAGDSLAIMQARQWGDLVTLTVLRGGQTQDIAVTLQQ